ncbi:hypothetical protein HanRHA438_Chr04g0164071 [Helianthus annuus]|nr:hypothetical protein HanRHA438_Chr04g0164071 [Helianthus annuus]
MQQTNWAGMQIPAQPPKIIPTKPMLVPPVIHRRNLPAKHQQKRRQRSQLINPHPLLQLHPFLNLCCKLTKTPPF